MLTYKQVQEQIFSGKKATREKWGTCRHIRAAIESDEEFINYPYKGLIVQDCNKVECDCAIFIYRPTTEEMSANDWIIL